jgi:hypothetical protein
MVNVYRRFRGACCLHHQGATIIALMKAINTFETSANFYRTTRRNKPEDSHFHTRSRENLKPHNLNQISVMALPAYQVLRNRTPP